MENAPNNPADHGEIVTHPGVRVSWAWLFPVLAALAAGYLFWTNWKSQGPQIEVEFADVPGIQAGKTQLIYRGVVAGIVNRVHLAPGLNKAIVGIRLKAFAGGLASEGTLFWIDQPVIGLAKTSGIESLIQGNSIQARIGSGKPTTHFVGSDVVPLTPLEEPSLVLKLRATNIPFLDRGSPVYFRGITVGEVQGKTLDAQNNPVLSVIIEEKFANLMRSNARFWVLPAASAKLGAGFLKLDLPGLKALLLGGIAFDFFGEQGREVKDGEEFELCETESSARACGPAFRITFKDGLGIRPGTTELRHLGLPVGLVESVAAGEAPHQVEATVRLEPGNTNLQKSGARFTLVRPRISMDGISGLETLLAGVFINCEPGDGDQVADQFAGGTNSGEELEGISIALHAAEIPSIDKGAPVFLRGIIVGRVTEKTFDENNKPVLKAVIRKEFSRALVSNAKFWRVPATSVQAGPGVLEVGVAGLQSLWQGGIAFDVFATAGEPAAEGSQFQLFADERTARSDSPPIRIDFKNGQGLLAGRTQLRHLGVPVGLVESVKTAGDRVEVSARLEPGHDDLRREGAVFSVIRPAISLEGVSGLEALVSGVYIECLPGGGPTRDHFTGIPERKAEQVQALESGFDVVLRTANTTIDVGAPVQYRGVRVGKIAKKALSPDGRSVDLTASIDRTHAILLRDTTKFWDVSGVRASLGFFYLKVRTGSLESLTLGGVQFATPDGPPGRRVKPGHVFELNASPRRDWLRWNPAIPLTDGN